jgi:hypothetical protein
MVLAYTLNKKKCQSGTAFIGLLVFFRGRGFKLILNLNFGDGDLEQRYRMRVRTPVLSEDLSFVRFLVLSSKTLFISSFHAARNQ